MVRSRYVDRARFLFPGRFTVELDGRPLKTPEGRSLEISSKTLAHLVAAEWSTVDRILKPNSLPLVSVVRG